MKQVTIDIDGIDEKSKKRVIPDKKKKLRKKIKLGILFVFICLVVYFVLRMLGIISGTGINLNPFDTIRNLIAKEEPQLKKDDQGRTNVLMVGIDTRDSNPGLQNTDTIIVASYNHNTKESILISIPRDMWASHPYNETYHSKINAIYNSCENQDEGTGLECLSDVAKVMTNLDIHYYAMLDISGLIEVVDIIGGVDIDVENAFTDYMFPNSGNGYTIVSFEAGLQHMDGEEAMQYSRSRHAQGPEGSDFARARRQQKVIKAIMEKTISIETYSNPLKILDIAEQIGDNVQFSSVTTEDIRAGINIGKVIDWDDIYSIVLDPSIGNWSIITEDPTTAYILYPELGIDKWDDVHKFITTYITYPGMYSEEPIIYVYNGGLGYNETALEVDNLVEKYPYINIVFGGNMTTQDYIGNIVLSFSKETKYNSINQIENFFDTTVSTNEEYDLTSRYGEDIMVILGTLETAETTSD